MKKESRREHSPVKTESARASELAEYLAPPEERTVEGAKAGEDQRGVIILDTGRLELPKGYVEDENTGSKRFRPDPVVILIFFLSLIFIAFITYLISIEPPK
jgi:hypothetical protein